MSDAEDIRRRLTSLGKRRKKLASDEATLMRDTEQALRDAYEVVPVSEQARLLGIHRTTIYRVYDPRAAA